MNGDRHCFNDNETPFINYCNNLLSLKTEYIVTCNPLAQIDFFDDLTQHLHFELRNNLHQENTVTKLIRTGSISLDSINFIFV